jgi:hypothetical protein
VEPRFVFYFSNKREGKDERTLGQEKKSKKTNTGERVLQFSHHTHTHTKNQQQQQQG